MDKIGQKANQALDNKAQPGDNVERKADGDINSGMFLVLDRRTDQGLDADQHCCRCQRRSQ